MNELPNKNNFLGQVGDIYDVLARLPGVLAPLNIVVAGGVITPSSGAIVVDTENQAASDDLNNINTVHLPEGAWVFIRGLSPARAVTLRHKTGGNGELNLSDNNFVLDAVDKWIIMERKGADWFEVLRGPVRSCAVGDALPLALGVAAAGLSVNAAREDHVHPRGALVDGPESAAFGHIPKFADSTGKVLADGYTVGNEANNLVQLDNNGKLPAVDGSALSGFATVAKTGDYADLINKPSLATVATSGDYNDLSNKPTLGTAAALDVGTSAGNVVQLDNNGKLPAVDGSQLSNLPATGVSGCNIVTFTSSGTWNKPAGLKFIKVYVVGGGGAGYTLCGGGGGGVAIKAISADNLASSVTVTVGNGGNNSAGGTSSFGSHCSASGGERGTHINENPLGGIGAQGGIGSGGDINLRGGHGKRGFRAYDYGGTETMYDTYGFGGQPPIFGAYAHRNNGSDNTVFGRGGEHYMDNHVGYGKGVVIVEEYC